MRSVVTTFAVLETVAERGPVGVSDVARVLDVPKSTAQRALAVLAECGWIRPLDAHGHTRWVLTSKPLALAGNVVRNEQLLRTAAAPVMADLVRTTGETIHLNLRDGDHVVLLDRIDGTRPVRTQSWIGGRAPIHASASGLAMLAHSPSHQVDGLELAGYTDHTITDSATLATTLVEIRMQGYAVNQGMWLDELSAIAAPIGHDADSPAAALSISIPTYRLADAVRADYGTAVRTAAERISQALWS